VPSAGRTTVHRGQEEQLGGTLSHCTALHCTALHYNVLCCAHCAAIAITATVTATAVTVTTSIASHWIVFSYILFHVASRDA
jgi:hypothetical protein